MDSQYRASSEMDIKDSWLSWARVARKQKHIVFANANMIGLVKTCASRRNAARLEHEEALQFGNDEAS